MGNLMRSCPGGPEGVKSTTSPGGPSKVGTEQKVLWQHSDNLVFLLPLKKSYVHQLASLEQSLELDSVHHLVLGTYDIYK